MIYCEWIMKVDRKMLEKHRHYLGLTQIALARKANLSVTTTRSVLFGETCNPPSVAAVILALGLKPEQVWID